MSLRNELAVGVANGQVGDSWTRRDEEFHTDSGREHATKRVLRNTKLAPVDGNGIVTPSHLDTSLRLQHHPQERWAYGMQLHPVKCPNCSHITWMSHPPEDSKQPCSRVCGEELGLIPRKKAVDFLNSTRRTPAIQAERNKNYWRWESEEMELQREQWI